MSKTAKPRTRQSKKDLKKNNGSNSDINNSKLTGDVINEIATDPKNYALSVPIDELEKTLRVFSAAYYGGNNMVSDAVFDVLRETLEDRDPRNSFLVEVG